MALKSGSMAYLKIDPAVIRKAEEFLDSVQMDGGASYGYTALAEDLLLQRLVYSAGCISVGVPVIPQ